MKLAHVLDELRQSLEYSRAFGHGINLTAAEAEAILASHNIPVRTREEMADWRAPAQGNADGRARIAGTDRLHPGDIYNLIKNPKQNG